MQILKQKQETLLTSILTNKNIQLFSMYILTLLVPALISKPQIVTGTLVNILLVYTTLEFGIKKSIYLSLIPSTSVVITGLLFGSLTPFIAYLIPFIIFSNAILIISINKYQNIVGCIIGSVLKAVFLFSIVNILVNTINLPEVLIPSMGYIQLLTATMGSIFALIIFKNTNKKS